MLAGCGMFCVLAGLAAVPAHAAPEEIVVFDDEFEKPGEVGFTLHMNYANRSRDSADYEGEQVPNKVFRFMPEIAWGLSPTWNLGLHIPMSRDTNLDKTTVDGVKLRLTNLHVREIRPGATWFYGANYELSSYNLRLSQSKLVLELRGIVGWRNEDWLVSVNPILNRPLNSVPGSDNKMNLDIFFKVMRTLNEHTAVGIEHYGEFGRLSRLDTGPASGQTTYAIAEFATKRGFHFHLGIGHGWTAPVDRRVYKAVIGIPF